MNLCVEMYYYYILIIITMHYQHYREHRAIIIYYIAFLSDYFISFLLIITREWAGYNSNYFFAILMALEPRHLFFNTDDCIVNVFVNDTLVSNC